MIAWIIVIVLLLLFLLLPVGADVSYEAELLTVKICAGLLRIQIIPGKKKSDAPAAESVAEKPKKEKVKTPKKENRLKITKDDIVTLLKIVFRTLRRFRKHLSIDVLKLWWAAAAEDPYDAVVQFGALNAGISTLLPLAEEVLKIREKDIRTAVDLEAAKPQITARVAATIQIWEILFIVIFAGAAAAAWYLKKRRQARRAARAAAQKGTE